MRYEEILLGRICCEEVPQVVPACVGIGQLHIFQLFGYQFFTILLFISFSSNVFCFGNVFG